MSHNTVESSGSGRSVSILLRLESFAALACSVLAYRVLGGHWLWFAVLFLAPDLSFIGYVSNPRTGATVYNLAHTYVSPALLLGIGVAMRPSFVPLAALTWIAHIGFDRALGYGLKYPSSFVRTHLGAISSVRQS